MVVRRGRGGGGGKQGAPGGTIVGEWDGGRVTSEHHGRQHRCWSASRRPDPHPTLSPIGGYVWAIPTAPKMAVTLRGVATSRRISLANSSPVPQSDTATLT